MKVKFFAYMRDYTGCKEIQTQRCDDVKALLHKLCERFGREFCRKVLNGDELSDEIIILVNGRHIAHLDGINTKLDENDEISIFPVVAGG